jgi:hypothetical protein
MSTERRRFIMQINMSVASFCSSHVGISIYSTTGPFINYARERGGRGGGGGLRNMENRKADVCAKTPSKNSQNANGEIHKVRRTELMNGP